MNPPACILACLILVATKTLAAPVEIIPPNLRGAMQPQVAVSPSGLIHVVFGKGIAIYHTASKDGRLFSTPVKVAEPEKLSLGMRRGPRVSATDKVVVVTANSPTDGNLHSWSSSDGGTTWKEGAKLNTADKSAREGLHAMAGDGKGFVFATWLDLRGAGTELWSATSHDGGVTWGANTRVYQSPDGHICECCHPSAAVDAQGRLAVMWRNWLGGSRDLYLETSADEGKTFTAAQKLGSGTWKLAGCPMDGGSVALNSSGQPITVWRREKVVLAGANGGDEQQLADGALQPLVLPLPSGPAFFWEQGGNLMLQRDHAAAQQFAERARMAAGAVRPDGSAVVVWESSKSSPASLFLEVIN